MISKDLTAVDLFCGAGGLSLGFQLAGFKILKSFDNNKSAVATYKHNIGDHIDQGFITEDIELPSATAIIGGPPCQGFSSAGTRRNGHHLNTLVAVFAKIVARYRPLLFVFENVEGYLTGENGDRVIDLLAPLLESGYNIHLQKVNVANYGVPQHRKRVIAIGGLGWSPEFPAPIYSAYGAPGALLAAKHLPPSPSVSSALSGLPPCTEHPPGILQGHFSSPLDDLDAKRILTLTQGQTMRELPEELWHSSYRRRANRRVKDGTPSAHRGGAPAGIRRLRGEEPAKAITSFARNEFVHPTENRFLTLRECARLQTFPDVFEFHGSIAEQALQIGNAVPPYFAQQLASHLAFQLSCAMPDESTGTMLSFIPTLSCGFSPALQKTLTRVEALTMNKQKLKEQLSLCL